MVVEKAGAHVVVREEVDSAGEDLVEGAGAVREEVDSAAEEKAALGEAAGGKAVVALG
jgi:hypothetical protein